MACIYIYIYILCTHAHSLMTYLHFLLTYLNNSRFNSNPLMYLSLMNGIEITIK